MTNARDAIIVTDAEPLDAPGPQIVYVNAAFETMTGYGRDEAIGMSPRLLQGPSTSAHARARIRASLATWSPIQIEVLNYRKDGSTFWADLSIVPIPDERGRFTHWISVQRDITARKMSEAALSRSRDNEERAFALTVEIERRRAIESQYAFAASHDTLTGLRNRPYLAERLRAAIADASRSFASEPDGAAFAVMFIDLDRFKIVNDSLGHSYGDAVLEHVAARLADVTRVTDTLARIGGDEFVVLLAGSGLAESVGVAERIIAVLATPIAVDGHAIVASPSIGIAVWHPDHLTPDSLMRDADTAMYRAKRAGGNRYVVFTQPMHEAAIATLQLQSDLRLALERDEFRLHYQPIVDMATREVHGFEALIRWEHPTRGRVNPNEFIPLAEEFDLIGRIGAWVLRRACAVAAAWRERCDEPFAISVNVSTRELLQPEFVATLRDVLDACEVPAGTLILEITESVFLLGQDVAHPIIAEIRALGVKIAFDDFGTGYSSLNYLDRFQIDILKIDRSFVSGVAEETSKRQIVRTIVALADALGFDVVAEGVEEAAQCDALLEIGCHMMQGFFFARPLEEEAAFAYLTGGLRPAPRPDLGNEFHRFSSPAEPESARAASNSVR